MLYIKEYLKYGYWNLIYFIYTRNINTQNKDYYNKNYNKDYNKDYNIDMMGDYPHIAK